MTVNLSPEKKIAQLEAQLAMFVRAAKQVLSDIDDDGIAERHDMGVLALREAVALGPAEEIQSVVACAKRVHSSSAPIATGRNGVTWARPSKNLTTRRCAPESEENRFGSQVTQ